MELGRRQALAIVACCLALAVALVGCGSPEPETDTAQEAPPSSQEATSQTETPPPSLQLAEGDGNADVTEVVAVRDADGTWSFEVTVEHPDTGWDDYADGWDVVTPDGTVLLVDPADEFTRLLAHPHVDEQPFTRGQSGIEIPEGVTSVTVRAHDIVDGFGGMTVLVDLTADEGPGFTVERR
jgi:hypothetical protein